MTASTVTTQPGGHPYSEPNTPSEYMESSSSPSHTLSQTLGYTIFPADTRHSDLTCIKHSFCPHGTRTRGKTQHNTQASQPYWGTGDGLLYTMHSAATALVGLAASAVLSVALIVIRATGVQGGTTELSTDTQASEELYGEVATKFTETQQKRSVRKRGRAAHRRGRRHHRWHDDTGNRAVHRRGIGPTDYQNNDHADTEYGKNDGLQPVAPKATTSRAPTSDATIARIRNGNNDRSTTPHTTGREMRSLWHRLRLPTFMLGCLLYGGPWTHPT